MTKKESGKIQSVEKQFLRNTLNYTLICIVNMEDINTERLINEIQSRRALWDPASEHYKNDR